MCSLAVSVGCRVLRRFFRTKREELTREEVKHVLRMLYKCTGTEEKESETKESKEKKSKEELAFNELISNPVRSSIKTSRVNELVSNSDEIVEPININTYKNEKKIDQVKQVSDECKFHFEIKEDKEKHLASAGPSYAFIM